MPFIGNQPALSYTSFAVQHFTTSATTSYTLDYSVANENEIRLVINNVVQQPGSSYAYTASGTSLVLSSATSATDTMYAVFLGKAVQTVNPPSGSVNTSQLVDGSVTSAKLDSGVALGKVLQVVSATDSTTRTTTSSSFVTASNTLSVNITPSSTSNKILLIATGFMYISTGGAYEKATIFKNGSNLLSSGGGAGLFNGTADTGANMSINYLDSPSSTSQQTYDIRISAGSGTAYLNLQSITGSLTAIEIAG